MLRSLTGKLPWRALENLCGLMIARIEMIPRWNIQIYLGLLLGCIRFGQLRAICPVGPLGQHKRHFDAHTNPESSVKRCRKHLKFD